MAFIKKSSLISQTRRKSAKMWYFASNPPKPIKPCCRCGSVFKVPKEGNNNGTGVFPYPQLHDNNGGPKYYSGYVVACNNCGFGKDRPSLPLENAIEDWNETPFFDSMIASMERLISTMQFHGINVWNIGAIVEAQNLIKKAKA